MNNIVITTNNQPRDILDWRDLTEKEQKEFDFDGKEGAKYFRYKKWCYCLEDFTRFESAPMVDDNSFKGWQAWYADSYWSGVVIKLTKYAGGLIVGEYYQRSE